MAITQERLIALIEVADHLIEKTHQFLAYAERAKASVYLAQTLDEAKDAAMNVVSAAHATCAIPPDILEKYLTEKAHFKFSSNNNRRAAENMRKYRLRRKMRENAAQDDEELKSIFGPEAFNGESEPTQPIEPEPERINRYSLNEDDDFRFSNPSISRSTPARAMTIQSSSSNPPRPKPSKSEVLDSVIPFLHDKMLRAQADTIEPLTEKFVLTWLTEQGKLDSSDARTILEKFYSTNRAQRTDTPGEIAFNASAKNEPT